MKRYKQLSLDEKICIQENVSKNLNYREITKAINLVFGKNRSLSTIYREINRHGQNRTYYNGLISEVRRQSRRKRIMYNLQRCVTAFPQATFLFLINFEYGVKKLRE